MNNNFKVKIFGDDTSNLFLAFLLLKKGFKVKILNKYNKSKNIHKEKFLFISHSTKLILDNSNLWNQFKDRAYSIESLSLLDISILKKIDFSFNDLKFNKPSPNNLGWIVSNADLDDLLLNEISKFNDVFSSSNFKIDTEIKNSYNNLIALNKNLNKKSFSSFFSKNKYSSVEFIASLRGYVHKRYYSIINEYGFIFICPINNNLFSVKWIIKKSLLERTLSFGKSFLLDNLSTIIPDELKIDQIIGSLNITPFYPDILKGSSKKNFLIISKGPVKLLDLRLEGLNLSFSEVIFIYNHVKKIDFKNKISYSFLKLKFFGLKFFKLKILNIFYELILMNNYFLYFLKSSFFYIFKKVIFLKKLLLKFIILIF